MKTSKFTVILFTSFLINSIVNAQKNKNYKVNKIGFTIDLQKKNGNHYWMMTSNNLNKSELKKEMDIIWASNTDGQLKIHSLNEGHNNPLIMYNGKELTKEQFDGIDRRKHKNLNINFIKGEEATKKYGNKAKNGVMIITSH